MTDKMKMPVVGKRYKAKVKLNEYDTFEVVYLDKKYFVSKEYNGELTINYSEGNFFDDYEELPSETKEEPKSIWKPVSEMRTEIDSNFTCLYTLKNGQIDMGKGYNDGTMWHGGVDKYCKLTDFINYIESLEQRIKKLEEK